MTCNSVNGWCGKATCGRCRAVARDERFRASFDEYDAKHQQVTPMARDVVNGVRVVPGTKGGPGTELKNLLMSLGLTPAVGCRCEARAAQMDQWGPDGCERNRPTIVGWLNDEARTAGWQATLKAVVAATKQGLYLNPLDPAGTLLTEALRRAAENSPAPVSQPRGET